MREPAGERQRSQNVATPREGPHIKPPYLHRPVTASVHFRGFTAIVTVVLGWLSLLLSVIAAGSCERAGGSGGAKRPRSGAAGALDAAARKRTIAGGRAGSLVGWGYVLRCVLKGE